MAAPSPHVQAPERLTRADALAIPGLIALAYAALAAFRYRGGVVEPDVMVMAAGMAHGLQPGVPFQDSLLYGRLISPGVYYLFHWLYPLFFHDRLHTLVFLNALGIAAGALLAAPLFLLYRRRFTTGVAASCSLIVLLAPLVWESGCSFHPIGLATLFLLLAIVAYGHAGGRRRGIVWLPISAALGFVALCMRFEIALAAPSLLLAAWWSPGLPARPGAAARSLARAAGTMALAIAPYVVLARAISAAVEGSQGGLLALVRGYFAIQLHPGLLARLALQAGLASGVVTVLLAAAGVVVALRAGGGAAAADGLPRRRRVLLAVLWAAPPLLVWLVIQSFVLRHFFLVVPALAWIVGEALLCRCSRATLAAAAALIVAGNLLLPEAMFAAVNRSHPADPKAPHGTFFSWHRIQTGIIERCWRVPELVLGHWEDGSGGVPENWPGAFVQVDWGTFGYLLYGMGVGPRPYTLLSMTPVCPGANLLRYRMGAAEVRMLVAYTAWALEPGPRQQPVRAALAAEAREARRAGRMVVLPREIIEAGALPADARGGALGY